MNLDRKQIVDYYTIIGGVPYYWKQLDKSKGLPQNIDNLFFKRNAVLREEFVKIYNSLFLHSEKHIALVKVLGEKRSGLTREEFVKNAGMADGGSISRMLEELELCGFVRSYNGFGKKTKDKIYQLSDFFSLFHLNFIENKKINDESFWTNNLNTPANNSWRGYAFEQVCLAHTAQIRRKLGIAGVTTYSFSWRSRNSEPAAQIDLVIDRNDRVINLCEMKYADSEYIITKEYEAVLRNKRAAFMNETKTRKSVHITFITTYGVKHNEYWGHIQSEATMDDLFAE